MKGGVLNYDDNAGTGQISGDDGVRYSFTRADLKQLVPIGRGTRVDFDFEGKVAKDIYIDVPGGATHTSSAAAAPNAAPAAAYTAAPMDSASEPVLSMWGYYIRAYTAKFAKFSGRARRKEYWSVALFSTLFIFLFFVLTFLGLVGRPLGGRDLESIVEAILSSPLSTIGALLVIVYVLVSILPFAGLLFRRVHDIGWAGWIAAVILAVTVLGYFVSAASGVASLATLIIALIPGKPGANQYGPSPK